MTGFKTGDPINIRVGGEPVIKGHFISVELGLDGRLVEEPYITVRTGVARTSEYYISDLVMADYDEDREPHPIGLMP